MSTVVPLPALLRSPRSIGVLSRLRNRVLILGSGQLANDVCHVLQSKRVRLSEVVGVLGPSHDQVGEGPANPGVIGTYENLFEFVERYRVGTIVVCMEDGRVNLPVQSLLDLKSMGLEVIDGQQFYEEENERLSIDSLRPSALIFSTGFRRRVMGMAVKRVTDVCMSFVGLVLLAPLSVAVGVLIKLDSPGPVFYRQMRVGLGGHPYMIWKLRTMDKDAEKAGPRWAQTKDPRISRVGRWLRKLRIDELPQLINVLKGEMSLVGPRPERPVFVQGLRESIPYYDLRHTVRPGITGWAQIKFRYGASAQDSHTKLQYDLYYVKNLSLLLDLQIVLQTARVALLGEGAR